MAEYIERESLIKNLNKFAPEHYNALINDLIMKEPAADVEPVRRGEWIKKDTRFEFGMKDGTSLWTIQSWYCICSECNKTINNKQFEEVPDFCPYCGSKNEIRKGDE